MKQWNVSVDMSYDHTLKDDLVACMRSQPAEVHSLKLSDIVTEEVVTACDFVECPCVCVCERCEAWHGSWCATSSRGSFGYRVSTGICACHASPLPITTPTCIRFRWRFFHAIAKEIARDIKCDVNQPIDNKYAHARGTGGVPDIPCV